ncbi:MAG: hypothetical protein ACD_76C00139G0002 [uncultured bacterium]|nr:MAG: hypothetical protein ACD_76C00139G0002 [uncultured bacterium]HBD05525.1 hypothetical protein [Candidatus Uhrbacteria bacterium]
MNKKILDEVIGWYGTCSIIIAYALISFEVVRSSDLVYQILNATGAIGIIYISLVKKVYQPAVLNIIWVVIAGVSILRLIS